MNNPEYQRQIFDEGVRCGIEEERQRLEKMLKHQATFWDSGDVEQFVQICLAHLKYPAA